MKDKLKITLAAGFLLLTLFIIGFAIWIVQLNQQIRTSIEQKRLLNPIEFYASPDAVFPDKKISPDVWEKNLKNLEMKEADPNYEMPALSYGRFTAGVCQQMFANVNLQSEDAEFEKTCFKVNFAEPEDAARRTYVIIFIGDRVFRVLSGQDSTQIAWLELPQKLLAQYYGEKAILKTPVELSDAPPLCLNSILAIEDNEFLEHSGFTFKSIGRAVLRNVLEGRKAQGGSTITQQLVKNYFLTHEKTYSRKIKELVMAVLMELQFSKDQILEAYINEIYMGQNATFEVRGFAAASEHYFSKKLQDLNLPECALLAAIVNSPGRFNPFIHPDNATQRRAKVLAKLREETIITEDEFLSANNAALPKKNPQRLEEPAPYFVEAVMRQIQDLKLDHEQGLKIYTTLSLSAQKFAEEAVRTELDNLEKRFPKLKEKNKEPLQGILLAANPLNGYVQAMIGGRDYKLYPYNRALNAHRQVGSTMKAFVYQTALLNEDKQGNPYTPITLVDDTKFTTEYDGQSWSPKNYENDYFGTVPLFFALKMSLNAATVKVALDVGLDKIVEVARKMGIESMIKPLPSLALGAFELYPWELLQAYTTIARMGNHTPLTFITKVKNLDGKSLFEFQPETEQVVPADKAAVLVGMMKQTIENGTGRAARLYGFKAPAAGKTGTTSDSKDAWFAGFTPYQVVLSWVGYDSNISHGLTGASGALPLWVNYMKKISAQYPEKDFTWPENVAPRNFSTDELLGLGIAPVQVEKMGPIQLIFSK